MIISASRRTDIAAFYLDWFLQRLSSGRIYSVNPYNPGCKRLISITKEDVDCIVFWTKDPSGIISRMGQLEGYFYYFLITITGYGPEIEKGVPDRNKVVKDFKRLSEIIGRHRVIWRYDPIFFSDRFDFSFHQDNFCSLAKDLAGYTGRCIISFLDVYKKITARMKRYKIRRPSDDEISVLCMRLAETASIYGIDLQTCSENIDLLKYGIKKGACIDTQIISRYSGKKLVYEKDKNQRKYCLCAKSIDIGTYNTCKHGCIYCYASR